MFCHWFEVPLKAAGFETKLPAPAEALKRNNSARLEDDPPHPPGSLFFPLSISPLSIHFSVLHFGLRPLWCPRPVAHFPPALSCSDQCHIPSLDNSNGEVGALITHPRACYPGAALSASWLFTNSAIVIQLRSQDVRVMTEGTRPNGRSPTDRWSAGPDVTELTWGSREWLRNDWHTALAPGLCVREIIYYSLLCSRGEWQKWLMTFWKFSFSDRKQ